MVATLPTTFEEWRGMPVFTPEEAAAFVGNRRYLVKGRVVDLSEEVTMSLSTINQTYEFSISFREGRDGINPVYRLFLHGNYYNDNLVNKLRLSFHQAKASQLECIVGVNQKVQTMAIVHRRVNYLMLPSFFEVVIKNGKVIQQRLYAEIPAR